MGGLAQQGGRRGRNTGGCRRQIASDVQGLGPHARGGTIKREASGACRITKGRWEGRDGAGREGARDACVLQRAQDERRREGALAGSFA